LRPRAEVIVPEDGVRVKDIGARFVNISNNWGSEVRGESEGGARGGASKDLFRELS